MGDSGFQTEGDMRRRAICWAAFFRSKRFQLSAATPWRRRGAWRWRAATPRRLPLRRGMTKAIVAYAARRAYRRAAHIEQRGVAACVAIGGGTTMATALQRA